MHLDQIKKIINSNSYDFLRTDEHLKDRIMLLTLGGSHAYGTSNENSDIDVRGFFAEGPREIIGLSNYEQFDNLQTDTVLYSFRKIVQLMLNCNPNTIEIVGTKPEQIFVLSNEGKMLRDNASLFLSQRAIHSFSGYATAQLRRLENALARDSYPQPEKEKHILASLSNQIHHLQKHYTDFIDGSINLYIEKSMKEDLEEEIFMDITMSHYPLRDFKNIYSEMSNLLQEYGKLNKRNRKKDEIHLFKHAMHLCRLKLMCINILTKAEITTYMEEHLKLLLDIRNGVYTYPEIFEISKRIDVELEYAIKHCILPEQPDIIRVEELVMEINNLLLKSYGF